jgi:hypothetical protein
MIESPAFAAWVARSVASISPYCKRPLTSGVFVGVNPVTGSEPFITKTNLELERSSLRATTNLIARLRQT